CGGFQNDIAVAIEHRNCGPEKLVLKIDPGSLEESWRFQNDQMGRIAPKRASRGSNEDAVVTGLGSLHGGKDQFGTCCTFEREAVEVPLVGQGWQSSDGCLE